MAEINVDNLMKALKCTQQLRANVSLVFEKLTNGMKDTDIDKDKVFLSDLRECLSTVNQDITDLDKLASVVPSSQNASLPLVTSSLLTQDPQLERTAVHQQIVQTYKWQSKIHEHAQWAVNILSNNTPKRTLYTMSPMGNKRQRIQPGLNKFSSCHSLPVQHVDSFLQTHILRVCPDISMSRPYGPSVNPAVLLVSVTRVMKAIVILRGLAIESVIIKAFNEEVFLENGKILPFFLKIDMWSGSKHAVFRKITEHAQSAMVAYPTTENALKQFLCWVQSYKNIFSSPCHKCGKFLQEFMPPTWHDYRNYEPFHVQCRP